MTFNDQRFFTVNPILLNLIFHQTTALFIHILCPSYSKKKKLSFVVKKPIINGEFHITDLNYKKKTCTPYYIVHSLAIFLCYIKKK